MRIITRDIERPSILRGERSEEQKRLRHLYGDKGQRFQGKIFRPATDGCSNTITTITKDNLMVEPKTIYKMMDNNQVVEKEYRIRKLTERECYRLMNVDEEDIDTLLQKRTVTRKDGTTEEKLIIPSSQHYKLAGNSIVVNCLFLIFKNIYYPEKPKVGQQLSLF